MSIEVHSVARMRVYTEPSGSFATDHTGTLGDFSDVPFVEGSAELTLTQNMLNPELAQQHLDGYPEQVLGTKAASLTFAMNLAPTGTTATSGVTAVQSPLGEILAAVMGGESLMIGDSVTNGSSPTTTGFDINSASSMEKGGAVGLNRGPSNGYIIREIENIVTNTVTLKLAMNNAAVTGDVVHGCATYFMNQDPQTSLQIIVEGVETDDRWVLLGGQLESMSLEVPIGELPRITFTLQFANWLHEGDASGAFSSALGIATYSNTEIVNVDGEFLVQTPGTATLTGSTVAVAAVSYEPQFQYVPVTSPNGTNTIERWRRMRNAPVIQGSFTTYYEDTTWFDARDNKTKKALFFQINNAPGATILVSVPTTQIVDVQRIDQDGISSQQVSWRAQTDSDVNGASSSDVRSSAFRIHFG